VSKIWQAKAVSFSRHSIQHDWKDTICGVYVNVSPGSAETLLRRGGITKSPFDSILSQQHLCQNRSMCVEVIVCNISVIFWDTVYIATLIQTCGLATKPPRFMTWLMTERFWFICLAVTWLVTIITFV